MRDLQAFLNTNWTRSDRVDYGGRRHPASYSLLRYLEIYYHYTQVDFVALLLRYSSIRANLSISEDSGGTRVLHKRLNSFT